MQIGELMCDLADAYGWPPSVLMHLSIVELLFWRSRNGTGNPIGVVRF